MYNAHKPSDAELPSTGQLVRSTVIALVAAIVILVTTVLPAEYAVDPTGIGRILGLTQMGEIKMHGQAASNEPAPTVARASSTAPAPKVVKKAPAEKSGEIAKTSSAVPAPEAMEVVKKEPAEKSDEISVILKPGQGAEVKVEMLKGKRVSYRWSANGSVVNYDTHGEPYNAPRNFSHSYAKGRGVPKDEGVLEAAFDGNHGWFWRNRTTKVVKVTLWVKGDFIKLKRVL